MWVITFKAYPNSARTRMLRTDDRATAEFTAVALREANWIVLSVDRAPANECEGCDHDA